MIPPAPLSLLREGDFLRLWMAGACGNTVRWMEMLAVSVYTFELSHSPFLVAWMMVLRTLPILLFGALTGAIADRVRRRTLFAVGLAASIVIAAVLSALVWSGAIMLWHIGVGTFLSGIVWSAEHPVRRPLLGEIAGPDRLGSAIGLDSATNNSTRVFGPLVGGLLYDLIGLMGAFLISAALNLLALVLISRIRHVEARRPRTSANVVATLIEGLKYVRSTRLMLAVMVTTAFVNLLGFPYLTMVVVIGRDIMDLTAFAIGVIMASEGTGAFFGSLLVTVLAKPRHYARLFYFGSLLFVSSVFIFSWAGSFGLAAAVLFVGGFGVAGFGTMQTTLILSSAPPGMQGRAMGALAIAIGCSPLGMLHLGLMADRFGAPVALAVMTAEGLVALAVAGLIWPELSRRHGEASR